MYALDYDAFNASQFKSWNRSLMIGNDTPKVECSEWTYDQSQFTSTIVNKVPKSSLSKIIAQCYAQLQYRCYKRMISNRSSYGHGLLTYKSSRSTVSRFKS